MGRAAPVLPFPLEALEESRALCCGSIACPRTWLPPVMPLGVGLAGALPVPAINPGSGSVMGPVSGSCTGILSHRARPWPWPGSSCRGRGGRCRRTSVPKSAHPEQPFGCRGCRGCSMSQHRAAGQGRGAAQLPSCRALSQSCGCIPPHGKAPSPLSQTLNQAGPRSKIEPVRLPFTHGRAGSCWDVSCRAGGSLRNLFPLPKDCSSGARPCKHREYHLIAAALGLELLGNGCIANILNNSLCNVCPGYCRIHFIIRALGCTLLIILSNNLHSTVSV